MSATNRKEKENMKMKTCYVSGKCFFLQMFVISVYCALYPSWAYSQQATGLTSIVIIPANDKVYHYITNEGEQGLWINDTDKKVSISIAQPYGKSTLEIYDIKSDGKVVSSDPNSLKPDLFQIRTSLVHDLITQATRSIKVKDGRIVDQMSPTKIIAGDAKFVDEFAKDFNIKDKWYKLIALAKSWLVVQDIEHGAFFLLDYSTSSVYSLNSIPVEGRRIQINTQVIIDAIKGKNEKEAAKYVGKLIKRNIEAPKCEEDCVVMQQKGQLKKDVTLEECFKVLCK